MLALQAPPSAFIRFSGQHAVYHPRIRLIRKKSLLPLQAGPSERDDPMPPPPAEGSPEAPPPIPTPGVLPGYESVTASMSEAMPPMCARYSVELKKPLGLVLEESTTGGVREIYVAKIIPGGNAAKLTGEDAIQEGDILISTSAWTTTAAQIYGETVVRSGEKRIVVNTRGESFDTIMAGIGSHKAGQSVTLELQRCVSAAF